MALPSTRLYVRSPYFINLTRANLDRIYVDLYIYNGELTTDKPAVPQYTLSSTAFDGYAEIEVSEFVRDYIEPNFNGTYTENATWVEWDLSYADDGDTGLTLQGSTVALALNGYSYFEDGYNYTPTDWLQQSSDYVLIPDRTAFKVPVLQDTLTGYSFARGGYLIHTTAGLTTTEDTANVFVYVNTAGYQNENPDRVILRYSDRDDQVVNIKYFCDRVDEAIKITFINRFGALQDIYFYGANRQSLATSSDSYKRNILSLGTYDTDRHQVTTFSKNGKTTLKAVSNWYPESSNATFQELFLSEWVWVTVKTDAISFNKFTPQASTYTTYPVNVKTQSIDFKKRVLDGMISYTLDFEFAFDRINSVR